MELMIGGCIGFMFVHLAVSGTPLRAMLINMMGENAYLGTYSVLSLVTFGLMITGYGRLDHTDFVWQPSPVTYMATRVLVLVAMIFLILGSFTKNPTAVKSESALDNEITGILKVTRHPIQWGILLFSIAHILSNGDTTSLMFFGTVIAVSFLGMLAMDNRHGAENSPKWRDFMESTSMIPFMAILTGRARFTLADVSWSGLGIAVAVYAAAYYLHGFLSGGVNLM